MTNDAVYLDNAATTAPLAEAIAAMEATMREGFYNPSAFYAPAVKARERVDACRKAIIARLKAKDAVFTSGGTEADNLAIIGRMRGSRRRGRVLFSQAEHPAVREACLSLKDAHDVVPIPLTPEGIVDLDALAGLMTPDTQLVCVMHVSNEVGSVQPLEEVVRLRDRLCPEAALHVDGVQAFLRLDASLRGGIDSYVISAHKVHGPKGVGALALGANSRLQPIVHGGQQEKNLRSGTENTPGIAGLFAAMTHYPDPGGMRENKLRLWRLIRDDIPEAAVNGPDPGSDTACAHILSVSFPPVM
ncbi:MAG TPA: aminotransferase class V-fold PLP-dependent enzyme, partial [Candidatus Limnocylindria bacterium]|nr:aminotransferase class V-fold PLP-dependent enzyme [Candidatus Limnocylindria bacterium]